MDLAASAIILLVIVSAASSKEAPKVSEISNDFIPLSGGHLKSYTPQECPPPYFFGSSYKVLDYWPDGANIEVTISPRGTVESGWTMLIVFSRPLPKGSRILVWNAEETNRKNDRYLTLVNRAHNVNLNNMKTYSLTFVVEGATMEQMGGFSAMVSFYNERIKDASCYVPTQRSSVNRPQATRRPATTMSTPLPWGRAETIKTTAKPKITRPKTTPRPKTTLRPRRTQRPNTTTRPRAPPRRKPTQRPRIVTTRKPIQRPKITNRPHKNRKPTQQPRTTARRRPFRPRQTTRRPPVTRRIISRPQATQRPIRRRPVTRRPTTTTTTTTPQPRTEAVQQPSDMPRYKISWPKARKHAGDCKILGKGYNVRNIGYDAGNDLADGNGRKYRFNVEITIPVTSVISQWTVKIVFAEPIETIQTWEVVTGEHSSDRTVWLIKPQEWNTELRETAEFLMIPLMRAKYAPPGMVYLCENGKEPTLLGNGIFTREDGGGHQLSREEIATQERHEEERQKRIKQEKEREERERRQREEEQRERERKDRERQEREERERAEQNRNERQKETASNGNTVRWERPIVTTTARPRLSGPRCTDRDGYAPSNPTQSVVKYKKSPPKERRPYDYNEVLTMSIMFYEAQRSGKLPKDNRIPWRGDSGLKDGCDVGHDLTGGWYDAGDHVKFGFPMAWSATTLAWGAIEFVDAYKQAAEYSNMLKSLKWVADYFVKAHTAKYEFWGQIGDGGADHSYWGKAEDMNMRRPASKITQNKPGTELAAETAAALAAISIVFKTQNPSYSRLLLRHAEELYEFADKYRGEYHKSIPDAQGYYRSYSGYNDELVWGALWLAKATNKRSYLNDAIRKYNTLGGSATPKMFSWDDKRAGSQVLIAQLTGDSKYRNHIMAYQNFLKNYGTTPKGMVWLDQWGSNRYAANAAMISLAAANLEPPMREKNQLIAWARKQIHLMLGDAGRSYVVGYGKNPPVRPHHRSSSCPPPPRACDWNSAFNNPGGNYFTLYGALVGGPNSKGGYIDKRSDYVSNEVATDFNAGFQSALAGLKHFQIESR